MDWPSLFAFLWCIQLSGAVRSHQTGRQRRYSAPELLKPPQRASGEIYWYAGKTRSISSPSKLLRGFPCNPIRHIYSCIPSTSQLSKHPWGPEPTLSSNKPSGSESNISIRKGGKKASPCWSALRDQQRASTSSLTMWCCFSDFSKSLCSEQETCLCILRVQPARQPVSRSDS